MIFLSRFKNSFLGKPGFSSDQLGIPLPGFRMVSLSKVLKLRDTLKRILRPSGEKRGVACTVGHIGQLPGFATVQGQNKDLRFTFYPAYKSNGFAIG